MFQDHTSMLTLTITGCIGQREFSTHSGSGSGDTGKFEHIVEFGLEGTGSSDLNPIITHPIVDKIKLNNSQ